MRQIGLLERETDARRFVAYLVTSGIAAHAEQDGDGWAIWVRDENHLEQAKASFEDFRRNSSDPRYEGVEQAARSIRRQEEQRLEQIRRNVVDVRGRWRRLGSRPRPLVLTMIGLSVVIGMASNMGRVREGTVLRTLLFCSPEHQQEEGWNPERVEDRLIDVRGGQLWRVITPIFVHYGPIHLAFNMIMFYQLGGAVEYIRGTWRLLLIVLAIAVCSNLAQALVPLDVGGSPFAAGMSGVVYGLFGYLWMKSLFAPELGLRMHRSTVIILMGWLFLGIAGFLDTPDARIANWAHGVGFLTGVAIGYVPGIFKPRATL